MAVAFFSHFPATSLSSLVVARPTAQLPSLQDFLALSLCAGQSLVPAAFFDLRLSLFFVLSPHIKPSSIAISQQPVPQVPLDPLFLDPVWAPQPRLFFARSKL